MYFFVIDRRKTFCMRMPVSRMHVACVIYSSGGSRLSQTGEVVPNYHLVKFFPQNCMKMKEIWPGGCVPSAPLDPPLHRSQKQLQSRTNNRFLKLNLVLSNVCLDLQMTLIFEASLGEIQIYRSNGKVKYNISGSSGSQVAWTNRHEHTKWNYNLSAYMVGNKRLIVSE